MLTTSELAEYLGVHVQAIYDLRSDGRGPVRRDVRHSGFKGVGRSALCAPRGFGTSGARRPVRVWGSTRMPA
ncbi:helix-turn-helix domain-containing protein [Agromyces marinus]|uniref:Helix-turn-helix domain-containing protein n=2 Tax=Agromyces marinus TaxID=1389020 RepID=A0ABM8GXJ5_9MICO|nr:hypothetical protein GCM10025870_02940 [Agromyces marinus]